MNDVAVALIAGTVLFLLLAILIVVLTLLSQRRRQQHTLEMTTMKNKYAQELLRSQLEIQEQTLRTISQEIHDNIGQMLSLAKLQLYSLADGITQEQLQPTRNLITQSISNLRDLSKSLNPERITDIGLEECIQHELLLLQKTNTIHTNFEVTGITQRLAPEKEIIVFRIFQELMNNVMKHAAANNLKANIVYEADKFYLTVTDDGKGFNGNIPKGLGLANMQHRAGMLKATLNITSQPEHGTTARLSLPLSNN